MNEFVGCGKFQKANVKEHFGKRKKKNRHKDFLWVIYTEMLGGLEGPVERSPGRGSIPSTRVAVTGPGSSRRPRTEVDVLLFPSSEVGAEKKNSGCLCLNYLFVRFEFIVNNYHQ